MRFKWADSSYNLVEDLDKVNIPSTPYCMILTAPCFSKNGYYGACFVMKFEDEFFLIAGNNDTGKSWKSPDDYYKTIEEAVEVAEQLWRPA